MIQPIPKHELINMAVLAEAAFGQSVKEASASAYISGNLYSKKALKSEIEWSLRWYPHRVKELRIDFKRDKTRTTVDIHFRVQVGKYHFHKIYTLPRHINLSSVVLDDVAMLKNKYCENLIP